MPQTGEIQMVFPAAAETPESGQCFGAGGTPAIDDSFLEYARQYVFYIGTGMLFSTPVAKWVRDHVKASFITDLLYMICLSALFIASISFLVKGSYNPFIYFNF